MKEEDEEYNQNQPQPKDTPYQKPWFIAIGIIAVLGMIGYVAFLG